MAWLVNLLPQALFLRLLVRRLLTLVPVLLAVTCMTFLILELLPGNAARQLLGATATPRQIEELEAKLHLNTPLASRYWEWLCRLAHGDLGQSLVSAQPVVSLLVGRGAVSAELLGLSLLIAVAAAVPVALLAAHRSGGVMDNLTTLLTLAGLSVASFVLGPILVMIFAVGLRQVPAFGFASLDDGFGAHLRSLALPVATLSIPLACVYVRFLRGDLLEQMASSDYAVTAFAKGLSRSRVLTRHALRNSLPGLVNLVGVNVGTLIGGVVVVEQVFAIPGVGNLLLLAINTRDAPVVEALVLLFACVTALANLGVDLLCAGLDPRIRHSVRT
jgi:peptide/nickel transport system permease protein